MSTPAQASPGVLTVTELVGTIERTLRGVVGEVSFEGEISELKMASSGHLYFTIKDESSQLSAVMWRTSVGRLTFQPAIGSRVVCRAVPNLFGKTGRFQMVVQWMVEGGEGILRRKFLELKAKLEGEGLFEPSRKRTLPFLPKTIGLVTSKTGAVVHDIMVRLRDRMPHLKVLLVDVRVQGEGAAQEIADAIDRFNKISGVEVLIVGRGGGSLEDLWSFNEEVVIRAIYRSRIPIISAVGHEVDVTLSDLVADVRAPTPTAAAEIVVPHRDDLLGAILELERRLANSEQWLAPRRQEVDELDIRLEHGTAQILSAFKLQLASAESRLRMSEPSRQLIRKQRQLQNSVARLVQCLSTTLAFERARIEGLHRRVTSSFTAGNLKSLGSQVQLQRARLTELMVAQFERSKSQCSRASATLDALSPTRTLERGFAIVERVTERTEERGSGKNGSRAEVITKVAGLSAGSQVRIRFSDGSAEAGIKKVTSDS